MISKRIKYICFSFILYFFLNIGNTSALVFNVLNNGSGQIVVDMTNNIGSTVNYTFTPRLITR